MVSSSQICHSLALLPFVAAVLVVTPRDTEVKLNDTTYMNCSTSLVTSAHWFHGRLYVYTGADVLQPYNERFTIERNVHVSSRAYNLVIRSVQPQDAGEYKCQDDEGLGESRSANLIVLDNELVCTSNIKQDGVIGSNSCGIKAEEVQLSCGVKYYGNTPPIVEWRKNGSNQTIVGAISTSHSSENVTYTLTVNGAFYSDLNNSSYECQTTRTVGIQHSCSYRVFKLLYVSSANTTANITLGEEIACCANSSQPCTYKWKWLSGEDSITMSTSQTLTPTSVGLHRCEATCILRDMHCTVTVMFAEVLSTAQRKDTLLALLILLIVPVICFFIMMFWIKRRKQGQSDQNTLIPLTSAPDTNRANDRFKEIPESIVSHQKIHNFFNGISGITVLDDELFILINSSKGIEVYDLTEFNYLRPIAIPQLSHPIDLASDPIQKHLHVVCKCGIGPYKIITIDRLGTVLHQIPIGDDFGCLSITKESDILLAAWHGSPRILVYNKEGCLYQTINLPIDFVHPWHGIKLGNGQLLVSHGHRHSKHRVCLINEDGNMTNKYGGKAGAEPGQLSSPYHLAVDSAGYILVADIDNCRILLFDPDLKFIRELISPTVHKGFELQALVRMYFDEPRGRLYIADSVYVPNYWKDGRFWVFDVMQ